MSETIHHAHITDSKIILIAEMLDKFIDKYARQLSDQEYNYIVNTLIYPLNQMIDADKIKLFNTVKSAIETLQVLRGNVDLEKDAKLLQEWLNFEIQN